MEPIIYKLPRPTEALQLLNDNIFYDTYPSPKLIKYGFNYLSDQLNMVELTSTPYYKTGLEIDFDRVDKDSISSQAAKIFTTNKFSRTFAEFWEILTIFGLLEGNQNIYSNTPDVVNDIISSYQSIRKSKNSLTTSKGKSTLVLYKYADTDIDENAATEIIVNELPKLVSNQTKGASMILQLFGLQTQITAEIMYYLASLYEEAYIVKPVATSDLSNNRYIVLIKLRNQINITLPSKMGDQYLVSIGANPPQDFETPIQCMNSITVPNKYKKYYAIKAYLNTKIYEGPLYQEMIKNQNSQAGKWIAEFTNFGSLPAILASILERTDKTCTKYSELMKFFNQ